MTSRRRSEWRASLELFALTGIAFAQPVFDLLAKNSDVLIERRTGRVEISILTIAVLVLPTAGLWLFGFCVGVVYPPIRKPIHAVTCGALIAIFTLEAAKNATTWSAGILVSLGIAAGLLGLLGIVRFPRFREGLRYLAIAPPLFAAFMLGFTPVADVAFSDEPGPVDIRVGEPGRLVVLVLDEFPLMSLLDGTGRIDTALFPNFAALAETSKWYRNTTTISPYTAVAVPAILNGMNPVDRDANATAREYPHNLFTLLGGTYEMNVHEVVTQLCPESLCPTSSTRGVKGALDLGRDIVDLWREFASPNRAPFTFDREEAIVRASETVTEFTESISASSPDGPRMDFAHIEFPHQPWHFTAAGQDYGSTGAMPGAAYFKWVDDWSPVVGRVRHLMQVQMVDQILGRIVDRLQRLGEWDQTTFVITADHGVSFTGGEPLRSVSRANYTEIMWTPFFIKLAGQNEGAIDDRPVVTIDILPTIADALAIQLPWKVDGRSALGRARIEGPRPLYQFAADVFEPTDVLRAPRGRDFLEFDGAAGFAAVLRARAAPPGDEPALRLNRIGPFESLIGRQVTSMPAGAQTSAVAAITHGQRFASVDPAARSVPWVYSEGFLSGIDQDRDLAIAINGRITALTKAIPLDSSGNAFFFFVTPPAAVVAGANQIEVFLVTGSPSTPVLSPAQVRLGA